MLDNTFSFLTQGISNCGEILDPDKCKELLEQIKKSRSFDQNLFIDKPENDEHILWKGVNPNPDKNNLLLNLDTSFIELNPILRKILVEILGENFTIKLKKIICGLPDHTLPKWVLNQVKNLPVPNLGAFIKPCFRDITYFRGIDWHQDIIDYPDNDPRFITLYIYLHSVNHNDAPLWVIPKSYLIGATTFPHKIKISGENIIQYSDDNLENTLFLNQEPLIGNTGSVYFWHSSILHGTTEVKSLSPRLSLRYLIERDSSSNEYLPIDIVTNQCILSGRKTVTRDDLNENLGVPIKKGNIIKNN